jgi:hypothetical protein
MRTFNKKSLEFEVSTVDRTRQSRELQRIGSNDVLCLEFIVLKVLVLPQTSTQAN